MVANAKANKTRMVKYAKRSRCHINKRDKHLKMFESRLRANKAKPHSMMYLTLFCQMMFLLLLHRK